MADVQHAGAANKALTKGLRGRCGRNQIRETNFLTVHSESKT